MDRQQVNAIMDYLESCTLLTEEIEKDIDLNGYRISEDTLESLGTVYKKRKIVEMLLTTKNEHDKLN